MAEPVLIFDEFGHVKILVHSDVVRPGSDGTSRLPLGRRPADAGPRLHAVARDGFRHCIGVRALGAPIDQKDRW